MKDNLFLWRNI